MAFNGQDNFFDKYDNYEKAQKKSESNFIKWLLIISIAAIAIGTFAVTTGLINNVALNRAQNYIPFFRSRQNILLLGVDSNGKDTDKFKGTRSDTILILNVDPRTRTVNAVSIPRDSKVPIAEDNGISKINSAHALGGPRLTVKTIEEIFGIKIDHYIVVDYAGVKSLVEALGGVHVNVEKRMHYDDFSGGLHVNLEKGPQILDATQAEEYLRFRHDHTGDLGRMERQRWFMRGVVEKLHSPATIAKIPKLVEIAEKYSKTDMNLYELSKFAAFASAIKPDEIQTATLPGRPSNHGSVSYWILDTDGAQSIIDKLIYRDKSYDPRGVYKVALLYNDSITRQRLDEIQANLEQYGFKISCRDRSELTHTQIIAHSNVITTEEVGFIKRKISELKKAPFDISLENYRCGETDLTLVLSEK